jgi:selenide, water dikinase
LAEALQSLPQSVHPDLLVGFNKADDAGIFRISPTQALVQTVDFFPPIVDDPYWFGQIAAANALSDIFAMGGRPLTALNIVGFPLGTLPPWVLTEILRGGNDKIMEAGAVVVGGHSIKDKELKYGVSVTGIVDIDKVLTNSGATVGDQLFLTKRLGTGIITTAIKRNAVSEEVAKETIASMAALNRTASELALEFGAHAATDITGFGLLGHAREMAIGSGVSIRFFAEMLPLLPGVMELAAAGMIPGGANDNREFIQPVVQIRAGLDKNLEAVLFDPQTSGGLLIAIPADRASGMQAKLRLVGLCSAIVGQVERSGSHPLLVD